METAKLDILMASVRRINRKTVSNSGFKVLDSGFFVSGTWISGLYRWRNSGFLELYSGVRSPGFQILQAPTSKNVPKSGIPIPLQDPLEKISGQQVRLSFKFTLLTFQFISCIVLVLFNFRTDGTNAVWLTGGCLTLSGSSRMFQEGKMNFLSFICRIFLTSLLITPTRTFLKCTPSTLDQV